MPCNFILLQAESVDIVHCQEVFVELRVTREYSFPMAVLRRLSMSAVHLCEGIGVNLFEYVIPREIDHRTCDLTHYLLVPQQDLGPLPW